MTEQKTLSKDEQEDIRQSRLFEAMIQTEGWKLYVELLSRKSSTYMADLLSQHSSRDSDMLQKGALNALDYCMGLPGRTIAAASDILQRAGRTIEDGDPE